MKTILIEGCKCFLFVVLLTCFISLNGCESMQASLERLDYVCLEGEIDGPFTESAGRGKAIKVPEGETLDPETIQALCP